MRNLLFVVALFAWWNQLLGDVRTENGVRFGDLPEFMDFEYLKKIRQ